MLFTGMESSLLPFKTSDKVGTPEDTMGQGRAIDAIELGVEVNKEGFKLLAGTDKLT